MAESGKITVDHEFIRAWAEERGGKAARVVGTGSEDPAEDAGILRIDFPGFSGEGKLETISWEDFFGAFEDNDLAFLYQDHVAGELSRFNKFVRRKSVSPKEMAPATVEQEEKAHPTALDLLRADHEQLRRLFADAKPERGRQLDAGAIPRLEIALEIHTRIEEDLFYPALSKASVTEKKLVASALEDHERISELLDDLTDLEDDDSTLGAKIQELMTAFETHVAVEEGQMFQEAERVLDRPELEKLGRDMATHREDLIAHPETIGPDEEAVETA